MAAIPSRSCPLWVISCRGAVKLECPLYPQKLPRPSLIGASVSGQKQTKCNAANRPLFDYLVGAGEKCGRNSKTKHFRGLQIDHQLELGCQIDWDVARLCSIEDLGDATGRTAKKIQQIGRIRH
jgi:hypothetical protein